MLAQARVGVDKGFSQAKEEVELLGLMDEGLFKSIDEGLELIGNGLGVLEGQLLDKVQGAQHFDLTTEKAQSLIKQITAELPGYLVPKLSREIAGEKSKTLINSL